MFVKRLRFIAVFAGVTAVFAQAHNYKKALEMATCFYGANRCGDTKSWIHGPCHTRDGERDGVDLSGGWHDCGDHIKFGQTNAAAAVNLLTGYNRFPRAFPDNYSQDYSAPPPNGIPDILDEVKIFTDYLLKALVNGRVYYQVGDTRDHNIVAEPVYSSTASVSQGGEPRYAYSVTAGASNYCGSAAAALALMYLSYKEFDPAYADSCLAKAIAYYAVGDAKHESISDYDKEFYHPAGDWRDDMALGAVQLYRATGDNKYLNAAKGFFDGKYLLPTGWVLSWGNVSPLVGYELFMATNSSSYKTDLGREVEAYRRKMAWCGYPHFSGWGSLQYATAAAYVALLYHSISGDNSAYTLGKKIIDFCLGSHEALTQHAPKNFSFLIGYNELGGGYPKYPHHRAAFGKGQNAGTLWAQEARNPGSVPYLHTLTGALVGGPQAECANYEDNINNYYSNEVCIYYNAYIVPSLAIIMYREGLVPVKNQPKTTLKKGPSPAVLYNGALRGNVLVIGNEIPKGSGYRFYDCSGRELGRVTVGNERIVPLTSIIGTTRGIFIVRHVAAP